MSHAPAWYKAERQTERRNRPGHHITRKTKGHPQTKARQERAYARGGTLPNGASQG